MFVRTIYAVGDPDKIDAAVEALQGEGRDLVAQHRGYRGMGIFVDRELGKLLAGTWWDSEQDRDASNKAVRARRASMLSPFATALTVDDYEVAASHGLQQPQPGAGFRLSRLEFDPADGHLVAETFQGTAMDGIKAIPGVIGAALFIDRAAGRATAGVIYLDHVALSRSRSAQAAVRGVATAKAHLTVRSVEEFEVAFTEMIMP